MRTLIRRLFIGACMIMLSMSTAYGELDLSISSPSVSIRGELYPDYSQPIPLSTTPDIISPLPGPSGEMLTVTMQASNFPQSGSMRYDFYLIFKSADTGKTYYAEFDVLKLLIGGFDLAQATTLSETSTPFMTDLPLTSDIDVMIPIRLKGVKLSTGSYYVISTFTTPGTTVPVGNRALDKITVYEPPVYGTHTLPDSPPTSGQ